MQNANFHRLASVVGTAPNVRGWKGEKIRLRCDIQEEPVAVVWVKESILHLQELRTTKAKFIDGNFESREERFDIDENFSLIISDIEVTDEGLYHCHVVLKNFDAFENSTFMTINSMASKHAIEECVGKILTHHSRCTYPIPSNTPSFNLTCVVSGFRPNISMLWTDEAGERIDSVISQQTTLPDDSYERFDTITVSSKRGAQQTFMCLASGDSVYGTLSTAEITVLPTAVVGTAPNVRGWKGEKIRLRCDIQEEPVAVVWVKESILHLQELRTTKAKFIDGNFESREERFDIDENFSLIISDIEVTDEGLYHCQVVLKNFDAFENSTFMTINSMASKHAIEECVGKILTHHSRCTYPIPSNTPSFNLTCVVSGFRPNISMLWTDEAGERIDSVISQQTTLPDDSYERFDTITVSSKRGAQQTFMCLASGDSVYGTLSTAEITVLPTAGKHGDSGLIIGLVIGVVSVATLFLLVGKCLQEYYPRILPRKDVPGIPAGGDHKEQRDLPKK
ncbi:uncharacterized protein [Diadema antillarum]|uniref:uncharacterized protein n=1 Tax=Diadema antillarum TaxID=105358 RepID=UPI003A8B0603